MGKNTPQKKGKAGGSSRNGTPSKKKSVVKKDEVVPRSRVLKAVEELEKYCVESGAVVDGGKSKLLEDDEDELRDSVQIIAVSGESFSGNGKKFKLKMFDVPHSLYRGWKEGSVTAVKDFKVLVVLKDSDVGKVSEDDLFDALSEDKISVDKVICGKDLKTTYKSFESRRALVSEYSLILADDSVVTTLPKLLGGKAYEKTETTPVSIKTHSAGQFSLNTLTNSIKKVFLRQLPMKVPRGNTANVHLGKLEWFEKDTEKIADNMEAVIKQLVSSYKIRSIFVKSNSSPVLPLYYNDTILNEITKAAKDSTTGDKNEGRATFEIEGANVHLSAFEQALLDVANPAEYSSIFSKQIKLSKRNSTEVDDSEKTTKKAKKI